MKTGSQQSTAPEASPQTSEAQGQPLSSEGEAAPKRAQGPDSVFPLGEPNEAYAKYFSGRSYLKLLSSEGVTSYHVSFEPGCRNWWHIHHKGGQILLCTGGRGYYQLWGSPAIELRPGDAVNIKPEVMHWHGAAPDSWFSHIAIEVPAEGSSAQWVEPVSDEEYGKLK